MNARARKVRARFAPETRFEVRAIPYRDTHTTGLERLKDRLLFELLWKATTQQQAAALRQAATDAAALAWATDHPLLLFPALLEEKAETALHRTRRQEEILQRGQGETLAAA